jgi:hypothetical protein
VSGAIGGYFPLELPLKRKAFYPTAQGFNSARAAFYGLIQAGRPSAVWMPSWICDAMLAPLHALKIPVRFYNLDADFAPKHDVAPGHGEWLLYVNYFGLCHRQEEELRLRIKPQQLIFDRSQAFFSSPQDELAAIYSPRKFFGVPDGGLLHSVINVAEPENDPDCSLNRMEHLLLRTAKGAEAGFSAYQAAEKTLAMLPGTRLSPLTERLLNSIDFHTCEQRRLHNFQWLHSLLSDINELNLPDNLSHGPLCYPLLVRKSGLRERLQSLRIYISTYWQDAASRLLPGSAEYDYLHYLLPLPVDQRYDEKDMNRLAKLIRTLVITA